MDSLFVVSPLALGVAFVVTLLAATVQGTIGFGFAVLSVPVLALLDPRLAPVPQLLLSMPLALVVAVREREAIAIREVGWILGGRLPGAAIGFVLLTTFSQRLLDGLVAGIVLCAVALLSTGFVIKRTAVAKFSAGVVSGTFALVASIGGPPLALLYRDAKGPTLRANLAAVFVVGLCLTIATRVVAAAINMDDVIIAAWLMPALLLGAALSGPISKRVEGPALRTGVLVLASLAAIGLIVRVALH